MDTTPDEDAFIQAMFKSPTRREDIGQRNKIGPLMLKKALAYSNPNVGVHGLGTHWTYDRGFAEKAAESGYAKTAVVFAIEWDGHGEDPDATGTSKRKDDQGVWRGYESEQEVTLLPNVRPRVTGIWVSHLGDYCDVMNY
jgi:hypothetical protein